MSTARCSTGTSTWSARRWATRWYYVQSDDLDASLKKVEELGGKVVMPVTAMPGMVTFALFADAEGNVMGVVHPETPE